MSAAWRYICVIRIRAEADSLSIVIQTNVDATRGRSILAFADVSAETLIIIAIVSLGIKASAFDHFRNSRLSKTGECGHRAVRCRIAQPQETDIQSKLFSLQPDRL